MSRQRTDTEDYLEGELQPVTGAAFASYGSQA